MGRGHVLGVHVIVQSDSAAVEAEPAWPRASCEILAISRAKVCKGGFGQSKRLI